MSVRSRITLGSLGVAAVLLILALAIVRVQVATILSSADTSLARSDLTSFATDVTEHPDETVDDPGTGVLAYVRDPSGAVQVNTLPHDVVELIEGKPATDEQYATTDDEDRTFVVVGRAIPTSTGTWSMWSARSTSSSELALEGLDRILAIGGLVLLGGFGAASWFIATLALRPVDAARAREKQMVSDAAHELRTPLAALTTQLELAHGDFGDAAALARQVVSAEASVDRLSSLASNLLELSRIESNVSATAASLAGALAEEFTGSVDRARMLALDKSVTVDFDLDLRDDGAAYRIGTQAFGRLTDNLLTNAIAAVRRDGAVVGRLSQTETDLRLIVSDDGPGMPEGFIPRAFERFSRPDASRATSTGGSGLGLALVLALAKEAGGDAVLENTHPGLRVTVVLPKM